MTRRSQKRRYETHAIKAVAGFSCRYCGRRCGSKSLSRDHLIPVARGGSDRRRNLAPACLLCNQLKADHMLPGIGVAAGSGIPQWIDWPTIQEAMRALYVEAQVEERYPGGPAAFGHTPEEWRQLQRQRAEARDQYLKHRHRNR